MKKRDDSAAQQQTILALKRRMGNWQRDAARGATTTISTGCAALDALLPCGGVRPGSLVEWLGEGEASGVGALSLAVARQVGPAGRPLLLIDTRRDLFPLSLLLLGFDLSRLVLIRPASAREALWACEEALRCPRVGLVWAHIERLDGIGFRRLQLAAEASAGIGFLVRSARALREPSWAAARLRIQPRPSRGGSPCFRAEVVAGCGQPRRATADILIDNFRGTIHGSAPAADSLPLVSRLDAATAARRAAGA